MRLLLVAYVRTKACGGKSGASRFRETKPKLAIRSNAFPLEASRSEPWKELFGIPAINSAQIGGRETCVVVQPLGG